MCRLYRDGRLVTTAGVARREGRYFLAQRRDGGAQSRRWEFPGGKCDADDADEAERLRREFMEELDVEIDVGEELGTVLFEHKSTPYILVAYAIVLHAPPRRLSVHTDTGWFSPEEMVRLDLADSDRALIERYIAPR